MSENGNTCPAVEENFEAARREMVARQIRKRGIHSQRVLDAMMDVRRHLFVSRDQAIQAYAYEPLPIGGGQTISQPFMVAAMAEALSLEDSEGVLGGGGGFGFYGAGLWRLSA